MKISKIMFVCVISISAILLSRPAFSEGTYVHVTDMSLVHYQLMGDGKVYFRNLNLFNSAVTGCCYAFVLDTNTSYGKTAWSTMLTKMAQKLDLYIYVSESNPPSNGGAPAVIELIGNW